MSSTGGPGREDEEARRPRGILEQGRINTNEKSSPWAETNAHVRSVGGMHAWADTHLKLTMM